MIIYIFVRSISMSAIYFKKKVFSFCNLLLKGLDTAQATPQLNWIEQLTSNQFQIIENFFTTMPKLVYKTKVKNPETKKDNDVVIEGLSNFFA